MDTKNITPKQAPEATEFDPSAAYVRESAKGRRVLHAEDAGWKVGFDPDYANPEFPWFVTDERNVIQGNFRLESSARQFAKVAHNTLAEQGAASRVEG